MAEFDYMVFLAVAGMIGALLTAFVGVIAGAFVHGAGIDGPAVPVVPATPLEPAEQYRPAA